jgi:hypothetical protein
MAFFPPYAEPGYRGKLISLGGVVDERGYGRQYYSGASTVLTTLTNLLPPNPKRISAFIQNFGPDHIYLCLGESVLYFFADLGYRDSFQIDANFPWTGVVNAFIQAGGTNSNAVYAEITVI